MTKSFVLLVTNKASINGRHVVACPPELSTMSSQWRAYFGKMDWYHVGWEVRHENVVSNQSGKFKLSPFQKIEKLTFPALALPESENRNYLLSVLGGEKLGLSRWKESLKFFFAGWSVAEEVGFKMQLGKFLGFSWHLSGKDLFTSVYFKLLHSHTHIFYYSSSQQQVQNWIP